MNTEINIADLISGILDNMILTHEDIMAIQLMLAERFTVENDTHQQVDFL